jgi:hypothetical protein
MFSTQSNLLYSIHNNNSCALDIFKCNVDLFIILYAFSRTTDMDIANRAIQVGGAREGQSFVLKV